MPDQPTHGDVSRLENDRWDYLILGTGMGGGTLAYALAKAGKKVLLCEKGRSYLDSPEALRGAYPELGRGSAGNRREVLARSGRWHEPLVDVSSGGRARFTPFIGCGTGGSSALSGMAMERFQPADFTPRRYHATDPETTLPEAWPIAYAELSPYYQAAERLFGVQPATPTSGAAAALMSRLGTRGLHPYRLPTAHRDDAACPQCQGYLSPNGCKRDAAHVCVAPAVHELGAELLSECEVLRLEATRREVTGVLCRWRGRELSLRADTVVLAAGALGTPALLLASASEQWPAGLANDSGLVGRNLMRHYVDLWLLPAAEPPTGRKELAANDLYLTAEGKWGTLQSFGALPPPAVMLEEMEEALAARSSWASALLGAARPVAARALGKALGGKTALASICEDLPYADNRVALGEAGGVELCYRLRDSERCRIRALRDRLMALLRPLGARLVKQAESNKRLAHVCGTCRFGDDPEQSVLDRNNRAHGIENLYVVDASFFPSSGGTNPSLTIAANALRVADHLTGRAAPQPAAASSRR